MLARPTSPLADVPRTTHVPGPEHLLQGREEPSPGSGHRTGLVLVALLAVATAYTVSLMSPVPDGAVRLACVVVPLAALPVVFFFSRSLKSI